MYIHHKLNFLLVALLTAHTALTEAPVPLILAFCVPYLQYSFVLSVLSVVAMGVGAPLTVVRVGVCFLPVVLYLLHGRCCADNSKPFYFSRLHLTPLYFIAFSMMTLTTHTLLRYIVLSLFFLLVIASINRALNPLILETLSFVSCSAMLITYFVTLWSPDPWISAQPIWYYVIGSYVVILGRVLASLHYSQRKQQPLEPQPIQMRDLSRHSVSSQEIPAHQQQQMIEERNSAGPQKSQQLNQQQQKQQKQLAQQEYGQRGQLLNMFLLVPFTAYSAPLLHLPLYAYILPLQFTYTNRYLFYVMLFFVYLIMLTVQYSFITCMTLNLCIVFLVNKNVTLAIKITQLLGQIWFRVSFVGVFVVLFWFALKTVNVLHIVLVVMLLLLVTRGEGQLRGFRERNWKYLLGGFQIFLVLRWLWWSVIEWYDLSSWTQLTQLIGISHIYSQSSAFNTLPFIISAIISIQYYTYSSDLQQNQLLPSQQHMLESFLNIVTICYYKLIPWLSHIVVITILLSLQFSLITSIILLWALLLLFVQLISQNSEATYERLYWMWVVYGRMIAVQIMLRYLFEFVKFPLVEGLMGQSPVMQTILQYQELLGLLIRESSSSYFRNTLSKFQLMIGLDFILVGVVFLSTRYYHILIQYSSPHHLTPTQHAHIIHIYKKYIDFKLTHWLHNFNELLTLGAKAYLKIYYIILGVYACFVYSYVTFIVILLVVCYYIWLNDSYYGVYVKSRVHAKMSELFSRWRKQREGKHELHGSSEDEEEEHMGQLKQQVADMKQLVQYTGPKELNKQQLALHAWLRLFLLLLALGAIILHYFSQMLSYPQLEAFISPSTITHYKWILLLMGTSYQSPIPIPIYCIMLSMIVLEIKCCSLLLHQEEVHEMREQPPLQEDKVQSVKFVDMEVSFRLGLNKIFQRMFVIFLVFISIMQNNNPFTIIYLCCAWLLNYVGSDSIISLSRTLGVLIILQYSLIITNTKQNIVSTKLYPQYQSQSWLIGWLNITDSQWRLYLNFGDSLYELYVLFFSLLVLVSYQLCFVFFRYNWLRILYRLQWSIWLSKIEYRIYDRLCNIYEYALVYSPLCITLLTLALYLLDYTATNMFLSLLSILFIYKSFLLERYTNSRPFWKAYFRILQLLIVFFMVVYCILTTPMYSKYCNSLLCSTQEFSTKITKTILLLILQVGIDVMSSRHFITAMDMLKQSLHQTSAYYCLAIAYMQNDRRLSRKFKVLARKEQNETSIHDVLTFVKDYQENPNKRYNHKEHSTIQKESWLDTMLELLPTLVDAELIMSPQECREFVLRENYNFIQWYQYINGTIQQEALKQINEVYLEQFSEVIDEHDLIRKLNYIVKEQYQQPSQQSPKKAHTQQYIQYRKSYMQEMLPFQNKQIYRQLMEHELRSEAGQMGKQESLKVSRQTIASYNKEEKKKLLYLLIFQSIVSNWHYLTYILMVLEFMCNMGVLTVIFPVLVFGYGMICTYQAPKLVWRLALLCVLLPMGFKFAYGIGLVKVDRWVKVLLLGGGDASMILEYVLIFFIVVQCLILKVVGLYDKSTPEVQCMHMALIRNIINNSNHNNPQQRSTLFNLLCQSSCLSNALPQYLFSTHECKPGYDYSTIMVTIQLIIFMFIFCFYDQMTLTTHVTFYQMLQYNQFTTGMVIMTFIQLLLILAERIVSSLDRWGKWEMSLIVKYIVLWVVLLYVHSVCVWVFVHNLYVSLYYGLNSLYFLVCTLQIKYGMDNKARGFMDRYTWYNGYIYLVYRAIPFLFQFKVFSDWTFTHTSLRLFDWLKFEEVFGKLYVAKCYSLYMETKVIGERIQWWNKMFTGFPLLFAIVVLLFGPLVLFSNLNPLAAVNEISGGYLQLSLKINKTNDYLLYSNAHITDIHFLTYPLNPQLSTLIQDYQLDPSTIQQIYLQEYSDHYWEISEGSYTRLMQQPNQSEYQISVQVSFQRNITGATPMYELNNYTIPQERVQEFKAVLRGQSTFMVQEFYDSFLRVDNNNGLHVLGEDKRTLELHAQEGVRSKKMFWIIDGGLELRIVSDKYSKAIFGYSVMSFYISIILVVANYFRFLFQGSAHTILMSDIPHADPMLALCNGIHQARLRNDLKQEQFLFWTLIDIVRSPDTVKALTGSYLEARLQTLQKKDM